MFLSNDFCSVSIEFLESTLQMWYHNIIKYTEIAIEVIVIKCIIAL